MERRGELLKIYEFAVWSDTMKLSGKCDCIEAVKQSEGALLPGENGHYRLFPVEYKHGRLRHESEYKQQLCAQALCLEEMYKIVIPEGALFFIDAHQRILVKFTEELRHQTQETVEELWNCYQKSTLPSAKESPKCKKMLFTGSLYAWIVSFCPNLQ